MTQDLTREEPLASAAPRPVANTSAVATDGAMVEELDRVLREAFGQTARTAQSLDATRPSPPIATPVMLPVSGPQPAPVSTQPLRPRVGPPPSMPAPSAAPAPTAAAARTISPVGETRAAQLSGATELASKPADPSPSRRAPDVPIEETVTAKTQADNPPKGTADPAKRKLRPLPPVAPAMNSVPIEPIAARRRLRWRPLVALSSVAVVLAIGGQFAWTWLHQPALPMSDAPPLIAAPVAPAGIPADPQIQSPPPVLAAPATLTAPAPAAASNTALGTPVPAPDPAPVPGPTVQPSPPAVESAGILGTPQATPFDNMVPTRSVRTTVIAANDAVVPAAVPASAARPLSLTDPATWPPGAAIAEPHPLPPRRR